MRGEPIHRQVDVARPRAARAEAAKRFVHRRPDVLGSRRPDAPLRDRAEHGLGVAQLVKIFAVDRHRAARQLAGEQEHRRRVGVRFADRGQRVRHAGPRHGQTHARAPRGACVAVGHVARAPLVARRHDANRALVEEGVVDGQIVDAGDAENRVDPVGFQSLNEQTCAGRHAQSSPASWRWLIREFRLMQVVGRTIMERRSASPHRHHEEQSGQHGNGESYRDITPTLSAQLVDGEVPSTGSRNVGSGSRRARGWQAARRPSSTCGQGRHRRSHTEGAFVGAGPRQHQFVPAASDTRIAAGFPGVRDGLCH